MTKPFSAFDTKLLSVFGFSALSFIKVRVTQNSGQLDWVFMAVKSAAYSVCVGFKSGSSPMSRRNACRDRFQEGSVLEEFEEPNRTEPNESAGQLFEKDLPPQNLMIRSYSGQVETPENVL